MMMVVVEEEEEAIRIEERIIEVGLYCNTANVFIWTFLYIQLERKSGHKKKVIWCFDQNVTFFM